MEAMITKAKRQGPIKFQMPLRSICKDMAMTSVPRTNRTWERHGDGLWGHGEPLAKLIYDGIRQKYWWSGMLGTHYQFLTILAAPLGVIGRF